MQATTPEVAADEAAIVAAAHGLRGEAVAMLSELVTHPSLLGHAQSAQAVMAKVFAGLGLQVCQADDCHVPDDAPIVTAISQCHKDVVGVDLAPTAFTGTTDATFFNLYGQTPAICYGPSGGADIHGIGEGASIDSLMQTTAVLAVRMARRCGVAKP